MYLLEESVMTMASKMTTVIINGDITGISMTVDLIIGNLITSSLLPAVVVQFFLEAGLNSYNDNSGKFIEDMQAM